MLSIRFQNPTQGPLITISWDDDVTGPTLAFVPAALSSAPADIAATSAATVGGGTAGIGLAGPLAIAAICQGDSSLRHRMPEAAAQPLRGLSRFRSAVASAQGADATKSVSEAVALPGEATESTTTAADVTGPIDWAALLAEDSNRFFSEAHGQIAKWRQEASRRLSEGESAESVSKWLRTVAIPEIDRIADVASRYTGYPMNSIQYDFTLQLFWDLDRCRRTPISY